MAPLSQFGDRRLTIFSAPIPVLTAGADCPFCLLRFGAQIGFTRHMVVEHWCSRQQAIEQWAVQA